ncbi:MAG: sialidase family protein, partial [Bacteroidota bacterium]
MRSLLLISLLIWGELAWGQNQNLSNGNIFEGEPYVAVNPANPQHVVVGWMGWTGFATQFKIKTRTSFDGGQSWSPTVELPHMVNGYSSADPCMAFDQQGSVFVSYIDFTGTMPPVTGGVFLAKSTDGGLTWQQPTKVIDTDTDGSQWPIDRPWMVISKSPGPYQGYIYVTTFNLNRNQAPFNPYLSVSGDGGNTFQTRYLDTTGWLAGNLNPLPMCSPAVSASGAFHGIYPSFALAQSPYFQSFLVSSVNGGTDLIHQHALTQTDPPSVLDYPHAKKGGLLLCNPAADSHLVFLFLSAEFGNLDVFLTESFNAGAD